MGTSVGGSWEELITAFGLVPRFLQGRFKKARGKLTAKTFSHSKVLVDVSAYQSVD